MAKLNDLVKKIKEFNKARGWTPVPVDIAKSVVIEASELLEHFQWDESDKDIKGTQPKDWVKVGEEVADVFWYLTTFCHSADLKLEQVVEDKLVKNEKKFPVEMFNGKHNDKFYKEQKRKYREAREQSIQNKQLNKYLRKKKIQYHDATVCFLIKKDQILLGLKKRGFGINKFNGVGGKRDEGETIKETAIRETLEEIGVKATNLTKMAVINFFFHNKPEWNQKVHTFIIRKWNGKLKETEEMKPKWFNINRIPYNKMWCDDQYWLPQILKGIKIKANFLFDDKQNMLEKEVMEVDKLE